VMTPGMISEIVAEFVEGTRERKTLGGTFRRPSGVLETAEIRFTIHLPNMSWLKTVFPNRFNAPTATRTDGNLILNANNCAITDAGPVNVHWTCEELDSNDIHIYEGEAVLNISPTINIDDPVSVEVRILAQPDENGNVARFGTGDLTADSVYDAATGKTVPATP
jgi:hypothetical protein